MHFRLISFNVRNLLCFELHSDNCGYTWFSPAFLIVLAANHCLIATEVLALYGQPLLQLYWFFFLALQAWKRNNMGTNTLRVFAWKHARFLWSSHDFHRTSAKEAFFFAGLLPWHPEFWQATRVNLPSVFCRQFVHLCRLWAACWQSSTWCHVPSNTPHPQFPFSMDSVEASSCEPQHSIPDFCTINLAQITYGRVLPFVKTVFPTCIVDYFCIRGPFVFSFWIV